MPHVFLDLYAILNENKRLYQEWMVGPADYTAIIFAKALCCCVSFWLNFSQFFACQNYTNMLCHNPHRDMPRFFFWRFPTIVLSYHMQGSGSQLLKVFKYFNVSNSTHCNSYAKIRHLRDRKIDSNHCRRHNYWPIYRHLKMLSLSLKMGA